MRAEMQSSIKPKDAKWVLIEADGFNGRVIRLVSYHLTEDDAHLERKRLGFGPKDSGDNFYTPITIEEYRKRTFSYK